MKVIGRTVGRRIAEQRRLAGFSQARLAERLNLSPETISRLETASAMPSIGRLASIADALEIELEQLFRTRKTGDPRDRAIERLVWLMSRRTAEDVEMLIDIAARIFEHTRSVPRPRPVSEGAKASGLFTRQRGVSETPSKT